MLACMPGPRCLLFFPGSRPELLPKAIATGADRVCMDLEDAVATEQKGAARDAAIGMLAHPPADPARLVVRINHPGSESGAADLHAIASLAEAAVTVMVPKVSGPDELDDVRERLGRRGVAVTLIPMIETVRGLAHVEAVASAEGVEALMFGGLDLSIELGASLDWESLLYARSRTVHAARLAGVDVVDMPFFDAEDDEALLAEAERARRLGFSGKAAIHPRQVSTIHAAFTPSPEQVAYALHVVEAYERERKGAFLLDGVMIDRPAVEAARALLARAAKAEHP
jgi:(S)-citramalyl-CoA lyase